MAKITRYEKRIIILTVAVQLFLLIVSLPANSYTLSQAFYPATQSSVQQSKSNNKSPGLLSSVMSVLDWLFTIPQIGVVSASTPASIGCCVTQATSTTPGSCVPVTGSGQQCSSSQGTYYPTSCTDSGLAAYCAVGTCIDKTNGQCSSSITKAACSGSGFQWSSQPISDLAQCKQICCDFGNYQQIESQTQCQANSGTDSGITDLSKCGQSTQYGACVKSSDNSCTMEYGSGCTGTGEVFHPGLLCTNPSLNTGCYPTKETMCGLGTKSNDVYFVDSCGNQANVYNYSYVNILPNGNSKKYSGYDYSGNNGTYWNYTMPPLAGSNIPNLLCAPGTKDCGLCNYLGTATGTGINQGVCRKFNSNAVDAGSLKFGTGSYFCSSIQCNVANDPYFPSSLLNNRNIAYNGESWCVYEGHVGASNFSLGEYGSGTTSTETVQGGGNNHGSQTRTVTTLNDPTGSYSGMQSYSGDAVGSYSGMQQCYQGKVINVTYAGTAQSTEYRANICGEFINNHSSSDKSAWTVQAQNRPNHGISCLNVSMKSYPMDSNNAKVVTSKEAATHEFNLQACTNASVADAKGNVGNGGPDCRLQTVNLTYSKDGGYGSNFIFDVCVPKYTLGFDLNPNSPNSNTNTNTVASQIQASSNLCSIANITCPVVWKRVNGGWSCIENCQCLSQNFANQMNNLCVSLGDCGGYVNVQNVYTGAGYTSFDGSMPAPPDVGAIHTRNSQRRITDGGDYNVNANGKINSSISGDYSYYANASKQGNENVIPNATVAGNTPWYVTPQDIELALSSGAQIPGIKPGDLSQSSILWGSLWVVGIGGVLGVLGFTSVAVTLGIASTLGLFLSFASPVGWIALAIGGVFFIFSALGHWLFGFGKTDTVKVSFVCHPWSAPVDGGANCNKCGSYGLPCTQYQCESLGANCEYITTNSPTPQCVARVTYAPLVTFSGINMAPATGLSYNSQETSNPSGTQTGVLLSTNSKYGCFQGGSVLNFSLETLDSHAQSQQEFSKCWWVYNSSISDLYHTGMDNNQNPPVPYSSEDLSALPGLNVFPVQKTFSSAYWNFSGNLPLLSQSNEIQSTFTGSNGQTAGANVTIFVLCESTGGQISPVLPYTVNLCVYGNPDPNPASITSFSPENKTYLSLGTTIQDVNITLNKAANCSMSPGSDALYANMPIVMNCTSLGAVGGFCNATLKDLSTTSDNKFFIKCNTTTGVVNPTSAYYVLKNSQGSLSLSGMSINIIGGDNIPLSVGAASNATIVTGGTQCYSNNPDCSLRSTLNLTTSGGASGDGKAVCKYTINNPTEYSSSNVRFTSDGSSGGGVYNSQHGTNIFLDTGSSGKYYYNITVNCTDEAGDSKYAYALFNFSVVDSPPNITRISNDLNSRKITVTTSDASKCYYNTSSCSFNLDTTNPNSMETGYSLTHTISPYSAGTTYYVRCIDSFGNKDYTDKGIPGGCIPISAGYSVSSGYGY